MQSVSDYKQITERFKNIEFVPIVDERLVDYALDSAIIQQYAKVPVNLSQGAKSSLAP